MSSIHILNSWGSRKFSCISLVINWRYRSVLSRSSVGLNWSLLPLLCTSYIVFLNLIGHQGNTEMIIVWITCKYLAMALALKRCLTNGISHCYGDLGLPKPLWNLDVATLFSAFLNQSFNPIWNSEKGLTFYLIKATAPSFVMVLSCLPETEDTIAEDTTHVGRRTWRWKWPGVSPLRISTHSSRRRYYCQGRKVLLICDFYKT